MSLQQVKRDIDRLKESTGIGHLQELLKRDPDTLTYAEICQLFMEVPVRQLSSNVFEVAKQRWIASGSTSLSGVSTERLRAMLDESHEMTRGCSGNEFVAIEKSN